MPADESEPLKGLAARRESLNANRAYAGVGHGFSKGGTIDPDAANDAEGRIADFLAMRLSPAGRKGKAEW